jgi:ElaB/YqjD/DUF883 family membrane-anchored ribosome-binding protein
MKARQPTLRLHIQPQGDLNSTARSPMKNQRLKQHFETPGALRHDANTLADDASALLEATKEIVDDKVKAAREQLAETLERSRELYTSLQEKALQSARMADKTIQEHPYQTAFVALGIGTLIGFLCRRRP